MGDAGDSALGCLVISIIILIVIFVFFPWLWNVLVDIVKTLVGAI